jgi:hypothetical protein
MMENCRVNGSRFLSFEDAAYSLIPCYMLTQVFYIIPTLGFGNSGGEIAY